MLNHLRCQCQVQHQVSDVMGLLRLGAFREITLWLHGQPEVCGEVVLIIDTLVTVCDSLVARGHHTAVIEHIIVFEIMDSSNQGKTIQGHAFLVIAIDRLCCYCPRTSLGYNSAQYEAMLGRQH